MTTPKSATKPRTVVPNDVKKPTDRQTKATDKPDTFTVNVDGRDWIVTGEAVDDFELLDDLHAYEDKGDATRLPSILRRLLGDDGYREAMGVLRDEDSGRVSIEAGANFVGNLLGGIDPNS